MGIDKYRAIHRKRRIPEKTLLFFGCIGGGIGGLLAQRIFHHKTKKKKFYVLFLLGAVLGMFEFIYLK